MKVLFVGSANKKQGEVLPIVQAQADSLIEEGVDLIIFPIIGNGIVGYLKNIIPLRRFIIREKPDVIHAHYSLCGYIARLASRRPMVVSIMGSFPTESKKKKIVKWSIRHLWDSVIVKSKRTEEQLGEKGLHIIPNGVNLKNFGTINKEDARKKLGFSPDKKYIIFVADPNRPEKNYKLALEAVSRLNSENIELVPVYNEPHEKVAEYMTAGNVLLLTSIQEGSPNVIKEAMASNIPIVSTNVGDVEWLLDGVSGTYVAENFNASHIEDLLKKALFYTQSEGRERLVKIGLDSETVAKKLIQIYNQLCQK